METRKRKHPINTQKETNINFYLSMILSDEAMYNWFYERYINIAICDGIVDFIDNMNYNSIIDQVRSYSWDELQQCDLLSIVRNSICSDGFLMLWVDEYDLPCSIRKGKSHFVHPILVYGYDDESEIYNAWFFDINGGYRTVEIAYRDMTIALYDVKEYYTHEGLFEAVSHTVYLLRVNKIFPRLPFDITIFLRQLKDYLYAQNNAMTKWYSLIRPEYCRRGSVVFGINVYNKIIELINNDELVSQFNYKSLHDFASHKAHLLLRLEYIRDHYDLDDRFNECVSRIKAVQDLLEGIRLYNMKIQVKRNNPPASLNTEPEFLFKLTNVLKEAYKLEMETIPQICAILAKVTYPNEYQKKHNLFFLNASDGTISSDYIEYQLENRNMYPYRIDIIRENGYQETSVQEKLVINDSAIYLIEPDSTDHSPVRTLNVDPCRINTVKLYTDTDKCIPKIALFPLNTNEGKDVTLDFSEKNSKNRWHGYHDMDNIRCESGVLVFNIVGIDPFMTCDDINIDADRIKYIHVRMQSTDESDIAEIFFTTVDSSSLSQDKRIRFHIQPNDSMRTYTIDMHGNEKWKGLVRSIRIDPVHYFRNQVRKSDSICRIESISFTEYGGEVNHFASIVEN